MLFCLASLNHIDKLTLGFDGDQRADKNCRLVLRMRQSNGSSLDFTCKVNPKKLKREMICRLRHPRGLTNGHCLGGRYNVKNMKAFYYRKPDGMVYIGNGAGDRRTFKAYKNDSNLFYQQKLEKANGSVLSYKYNKNVRFGLSNIKCGTKDHHFSEIAISDHRIGKNLRRMTYKSSDGKQVTYDWLHTTITEPVGEGEGAYLAFYHNHKIVKVQSSCAPPVEYDYSLTNSKNFNQVASKIWPNKRYVNINYYWDSHPFFAYRVRSLYAPVGFNSHPVRTHFFKYCCAEYKKNGSTKVYDAYNHCKKFSYDSYDRPTEITLFSGTTHKKRRVYSQELFKWGRGNQEGNLAGKVVVDGHGVVHHARYFKYDDAGNEMRRELCGPLTGLSFAPLVLKDSLSLADGNYDREIKTYTYSNDGRNLMLSETDSNGVVFLQEFGQETDHVTAKFVFYDHQIRQREFYTHDQFGALCRKIVDDGSSREEADLTGVTQRLITYISNRSTAPVGYPEMIVNCCFNFKTGCEERLSSQILHYSEQGQLVAQENYDAHQELAFTLTFEYDNYGNVIREVNALGHVITRKYDENNNLIFEQGPSLDFYTKNKYDYSNRLIRQEEFHPHDLRFATTYKYNHLSQCIANNNPYGQEIKQTFDEFGRVTEVEYPPLVDGSGELKVPVTRTTYNCANQPIVVVDELGRETHTIFNIRGQPLSITHPNGAVETFIYRLDGQLLEKKDRTGVVTRYQRDPIGRVTDEAVYGEGILLKEKHYVYNSLHLIHSTDETGLTTTYFYDAAGRIEEVTTGQQKQQLRYDSWGRVSEKIEWFGQGDHYKKTLTQYDKLNRVIEEKIVDHNLTTLRYHKYGYDERGNKVYSQHGDQITLTEYNTQNQPVKITNGAGEVTHTTYNLQFIDAYGRQVLQTTTTDPLGYQTIDTYDPANRLVQVERKNPYGILVSKQTTFYDLCGNISRVQNHQVEEGEIKETIESYLYYTLDNQILLSIQANGRSEQKINRYSYNAIGQKTEWIKNDSTTFSYTYDNLGRLHSLISSDGTIHYTYTYNLRDQLIHVEDSAHQKTSQRSYDLYGNLCGETLAHGLSLSYTYDFLKRPLKITLPDQTGIEYTYDACNLTHIHRLIDEQQSYSHTNTLHNLQGKPTQSTSIGGTQVHHAYDNLGRCIKIETPHYTQEVPEKGYDPAGNLILCHTQQEAAHYTYDDLYQLIKEKEHNYQFDSLNNRIKKDGETATYNALHQLLQQGSSSYIYDRNGNLLQRLENGKLIEYSYDALDRLVSVQKDGEVTTYIYDPFHRRITKKSNHQESHFLYHDQDEIGRWQENTLKELRILDNCKKTLALELEKKIYLPVQDIHSNIVCLQNFQGEAIERYRYTAYGEIQILGPDNQIIEVSSVNNPWLYSNKRFDAESGLTAFGLRYYDARLGRWITPDPAGTMDGPNLYAYVHNNPLTFKDEYGLFGSVAFAVNLETPLDCFDRFQISPREEPIKEKSCHWNLESAMCFSNKVINTCIDNGLVPICSIFGISSLTEEVQAFNVNSFSLSGPSTNSAYQFKEHKNMMFGGNNGILTTLSDAYTNAFHLATLLDVNVHYVHSPTFGVGNDISRAILGHFYIATETVREIHGVWKNFFKENPQGHVFWVCHSRGTIDTRNALYYFSEHLRDRITVLAVAPALFIDKKLCENVVHLVGSDCVPYTDSIGMLMNYGAIEFLEREAGAGFIDHSFTSPTYNESIIKHYKQFVKGHGH